jgi:hypothetical protein
MKPCPGCGKGPDETEFYGRRSHTTRCKPCWRAYQRAHYVPKVRVHGGGNPKPKHSVDAAVTLAGLMGARLS